MQNHLQDIMSGTITRTNVMGIRKAINATRRDLAGYSVSRTAPKISALEVASWEDALRNYAPHVDATLYASGKALLTNKRYAKRFSDYQRDIIANLSRFELIRFDRIGSGGSVPVYRAVASDGRSFDFRNIPWQSGGDGPEALS